jgi:CRISPR-associated protein Cmr2
MTTHLLAISIGPVQELIAAARRTRDLWLGSYLLSEISKATARSVAEQGGTLIFPAPKGPDELASHSPLNVANVILAELTQAAPRAVAGAAKDAAKRAWRQFADAVGETNRSVLRPDIWETQVDDVIEFYAAWEAVPDGENTYQAARARVMRRLAGRKNCRDFAPAEGRQGVPKSSLDGLRESVLKNPKQWPKYQRRRLRVRPGEQLDVVGLVKRTWTPKDGPPRYPSVSRIAADPWLRGLLSSLGPDVLRPLCDACDAVGQEGMHLLDVSADSGHPHYRDFPYEGTAVFRSRHHELSEEAELSSAELQSLATALAELTRSAGEPNPYLAVLVADGDRVGRALSNMNTAEEHRQFSQQLSQFAEEARAIVHSHRGVLVYSGGDDVLAFAPVDHCLQCARALHDAFGSLMQPWAERTGMDLTLSVGVAIGHFLDNLEDLLNFGREAERHAKRPRTTDGAQPERNGLAVHLLKRGGGPIRVRANWSDSSPELPASLDLRLEHLARLINKRAVSGRVAYELHRIAEVYDDWSEATVAAAIQGDMRRLIRAKQPRGESAMSEIAAAVEHVNNAAALRRFADELLVARQVATAMRQAEGRSALEEEL